MTEWIKTNALVIITLVVILISAGVGWGYSKAGIDKIDKLETRQIEILERLSHMEGRFYAQEINE